MIFTCMKPASLRANPVLQLASAMSLSPSSSLSVTFINQVSCQYIYVMLLSIYNSLLSIYYKLLVVLLYQLYRILLYLYIQLILII